MILFSFAVDQIKTKHKMHFWNFTRMYTGNTYTIFFKIRNAWSSRFSQYRSI